MGIEKFDRHFIFDGDSGFVVMDDLQTTQPRRFTTLLHADRQIEPAGDRRFRIRVGDAQLLTTIVSPEGMRAVVEPNIVTAPGPPGSVDKGVKQNRGVRLAVSTLTPATSARFVQILSVETSPNTKATR